MSLHIGLAKKVVSLVLLTCQCLAIRTFPLAPFLNCKPVHVNLFSLCYCMQRYAWLKCQCLKLFYNPSHMVLNSSLSMSCALGLQRNWHPLSSWLVTVWPLEPLPPHHKFILDQSISGPFLFAFACKGMPGSISGSWARLYLIELGTGFWLVKVLRLRFGKETAVPYPHNLQLVSVLQLGPLLSYLSFIVPECLVL